MKKIYTLIPLAFMASISASALAAQGTCVLNLVKENGNFAPSDYGSNGQVTYNVTMPFTDGYYPNPWTSSQPKPRLPFSNCIAYQGAPSNAKVNSVSYSYKFQEAVLVADYQIMMAFFGPQNKFEFPFKRGGGNPRGSGISLDGGGVSINVNGQLLSAIELELRSRVTNPAINSDCPSYIRRDQCRTKNSRLSDFTATISWSN